MQNYFTHKAQPLQKPNKSEVMRNLSSAHQPTANLPTNIVGFRGFDSSIILI